MEYSKHLSPHEVAGYWRRTLSPRALLAADDHLAGCLDCRQRMLQLDSRVARRLAEALFPEPERKNWWPVVAAAAFAACVIGLALLLHQKPAPAPQPVAKVELPQDLKALRDRALDTGHVDVPAYILRLGGVQSSLRGAPNLPPRVRLDGPLGTATLSTTPEFHWQALQGASWYRVSIFDSEFNLVEESPTVHERSWTPLHPLRPGQVYLWQLTTQVGSHLIKSPQPPAPEARFLVLPEKDSARLREVAGKYPDDHILRGVLYANAGALEDARREWEIATKRGHPEAAVLLR